MPPIRGVAEIALNARDLNTMVEFYTAVLGFQEFTPETDEIPASVRPESGEPTIVFLRLGEDDACPARAGSAHPPLLVLIDPARHPPAADRFDTPQTRASTLNHLALDIDERDHDAWAEHLAGLGVAITPVEFGWMRAKALFFRDPEGNSVELICRDRGVG